MKNCDLNIQRTIDLTQEMIRMADRGDADREDTGCGILYGMLRDAAYKLWRMAEEEKERHIHTSTQPNTIEKEDPSWQV